MNPCGGPSPRLSAAERPCSAAAERFPKRAVFSGLHLLFRPVDGRSFSTLTADDPGALLGRLAAFAGRGRASPGRGLGVSADEIVKVQGHKGAKKTDALIQTRK